MKNRILKILGIICLIYLALSLLLNFGFKDPIFKREFIINNYSKAEVNIYTSSESEIFNEGIIFPQETKKIVINDTNISKTKKDNLILKENDILILDGKQFNFKSLIKNKTVKTSSGVLITFSNGTLNSNSIFFPFYIKQMIYIYQYKIDVY